MRLSRSLTHPPDPRRTRGTGIRREMDEGSTFRRHDRHRAPMSGAGVPARVVAMNNDVTHTIDRHPLRTLATDIVRPAVYGADPARRRLLLARQAVAFVGTSATLVQIIVWLLIALLGGGLAEPWWLWTAVPVAVALAALTGADRRRAGPAHP